MKGGRVIGNDERLVPSWHNHQLRHNFASLVRERFGAEAVSTAIGDKSSRMVDLYAERKSKLAAAVAE